MSKYELQLAGWIAAVSAALTIPLFAFQAVAAQAGLTVLSAGIQLVNVLLFLYVLSCLRTLLAQKHCALANTYLAAIIGVTLCVQCMALFVSELPALSLPMLASLVVLGILYIVAGIKLMSVAPPLPGLRLFSYAAMVVGACSASIVLALLVLPASMVMDVALAILFFREAADTANPSTDKPQD
ncbi:MAG: hypothetical protein K8S22_11090 [Betaproteobacteria bacterium]|nr:hypothetical protein [Betaproteobacteria bacterium]